MKYPYQFEDVEQQAKVIVNREYWRVQRSMEVEDLMQEARLQFYLAMKRADKTGKDISDWGHFRNSYLSGLRNHIVTLSNKDTAKNKVVLRETDWKGNTDMTFDELAVLEGIGIESGALEISGEMLVLIENAPEDVKRVIHLAVTDDDTIKLFASSSGTRGRKSLNQHFCRKLGISPKIDVINKTLTYLRSSP